MTYQFLEKFMQNLGQLNHHPRVPMMLAIFSTVVTKVNIGMVLLRKYPCRKPSATRSDSKKIFFHSSHYSTLFIIIEIKGFYAKSLQLSQLKLRICRSGRLIDF